MATLLSLLAAVVTAVVCMLVYDASIAVLLVLIPISVVIFCISLLIGHFLSEPLSDLAKKMAAFRSGAPVTFEPDGRMYEADLLTSEITAIRRSLESAVERLCELWLILHGFRQQVLVDWEDINLQDEVEEARAALYLQQARKLRVENDEAEEK